MTALLSALASFIPDAQAAGGIGAPPEVGLPTAALPKLLLGIINFSLILVGVLALLYFVYGGFLYITSRGDEQQVERAKHIMIYAILGIFFIGIAAAIINFAIDAVIGSGGQRGGPGGAR